ncbi:MAG: FAD binding domain-containing protein [Anaerolineales bacterium]|nr:FAD binding domain-containing protein [Anaerolineales bacterium]
MRHVTLASSTTHRKPSTRRCRRSSTTEGRAQIIAGLNEIWEAEGWVYLSAATTHTQIESNDLVRKHGTALTEICGVVGGPQVRNVGTLDGNVATRSLPPTARLDCWRWARRCRSVR